MGNFTFAWLFFRWCSMMKIYYLIIFLLPSSLWAGDAMKNLQCKMGDSKIDDGVWYQGQCVDPYEDAVCGEEALGQRLFVREDEVICDCDEVDISLYCIFCQPITFSTPRAG